MKYKPGKHYQIAYMKLASKDYGICAVDSYGNVIASGSISKNQAVKLLSVKRELMQTKGCVDIVLTYVEYERATIEFNVEKDMYIEKYGLYKG